MACIPRLREGSQSFNLPVGKHSVRVSVVVSRFDLEGKACFKSQTRVEPCCNDNALNAGELNPSIDDLHVKAFGLGGWLYTDRDYLRSLRASCEEGLETVIPQSSVRPAVLDDDPQARLRGLKERFEDWKQKSEAQGKASKASTSDPKEKQAAAKKEQAVVKKEFVALKNDLAALKQSMKRRRESRVEDGSGVEKRSRVQDLKTTVDDFSRGLKDYEILDNFIGQVVQGITALNNQDDRSQSTEDLFNPLIQYRQRHKRHNELGYERDDVRDDDGKELRCVLENMAEAAESHARTGFVCRFISHLVEHLYRQRDPTYSRSGDFDRERETKRADLVAVLICRIVNGLQEHKGIEAFVVLNALVGRGYNASPIRSMGRVRQDAFVSSAILRLAQLDLTVPGHTRLFHPAALLHWVSAGRFDFATVCKFIGLEGFSVDLSPRIHALAEGWRIGDIPFAMTIPLSECRSIIPADIGPMNSPGGEGADQDRPSGSRPRNGQHEEGSPRRNSSGGVALTTPGRQGNGPQLPRFDQAVSASAALLPPRNSHAVSVNAEPDAGSGQASSCSLIEALNAPATTDPTCKNLAESATTASHSPVNTISPAHDGLIAPRQKRRRTRQHATHATGRRNYEHHLPGIHHAVVLVKTALPPHSNPSVLVDSEPARTDKAPSPPTRSFQPVNRRDGTIMPDAASESCQSNSRRVSVAPKWSPLNPVSDVAGLGHTESPSSPMVPTLGPPERTSSWGPRPNEFSAEDVPSSLDGQGRPWDESGRRVNGISPHHAEGVVGCEIGSMEQCSVNGPSAGAYSGPERDSGFGTLRDGSCESGQSGTAPVSLPSDAAVGNAALQSCPSAADEMDQPTSEESSGEAVGADGIATVISPQVPASQTFKNAPPLPSVGGDQPTSEVNPVEAVMTEGVGNVACPQAISPLAMATVSVGPDGSTDFSGFMQELSTNQWSGMGYVGEDYMQMLTGMELDFMDWP